MIHKNGRAEIAPSYRVNIQLMNLLRSIARVSGHTEVRPEALELLRKVALGLWTRPGPEALQLIAESPEGLTVNELTADMGFHKNTVDTLLKNMVKAQLLIEGKRKHRQDGCFPSGVLPP